jgi:hypothetical protein
VIFVDSSAAAANHRAGVNRRNALRSTGPVTREGKRKASLNARRHGLTGQTVVLPDDDLPVYQNSCDQFSKPKDPQLKGSIRRRMGTRGRWLRIFERDLDACICRRPLTNEAEDFHYLGRLPDPPSEPSALLA